MSTPRIGPHGSPSIPADTEASAGPAQPAQQRALTNATDQVEPRLAKSADARPQQATTLAFSPPQQAERRAFLGGERGAWPQAVRDTVLELADNRELGRVLLDAFNRGFA